MSRSALPSLLAAALVCAPLSGCRAPAPSPQAARPEPAPVKTPHQPPRLVLQITVDQLRGDLPRRFADRFGEGGFRLLHERGAVFENAHHRHANTETIVGHTTLATGADPGTHGMIGNVWLDRDSDQVVYNVEDARYPLLSANAGVNKATEIDPTQRAARSDGRSPAAIRVTTFSDELRLFAGEASKVFGVSVKDRGAISMAGHAGKAFWFSKSSGEFVTSSFYYETLPDWAAAWNAKGHPKVYAGTSWTLMKDPASYRAEDDRPFETKLGPYGRTFPHAFGKADSKLFNTLLTVSPAGDELTVEFAKTLIASEGLGADDVTDYLSVSLSSTDYVGHVFGPSSVEAEDNLYRLDRTLAGLLAFVDETVGLERTLVVLSADHGGAEAPGALAPLGIDVTPIDPESFAKAEAMEALKARFGAGKSLISGYHHPYVYLHTDVIAELGLNQADVEEAVAAELTRFPGVALAVSSSALARGAVPDTRIYRSILSNYDRSRSGDVYVVFEPHRFIADMDGLVVAAHHGSPWRYDTYVPLVFMGAGIPAQRITREVQSVDVAPTLSLLVGAKTPSGCDGTTLPEVLGGR